MSSLFQYWKRIGSRDLGGASEAEISSFESQHNVVFPHDFRTYLSGANGTSGDLKDNFRFLPLRELRAANDPALPMSFGAAFDEMFPECGETFFVFADYLQWCYGYAIQLSENLNQNAVVLIGGLTCPIVADNFSEFVELYLRDDPKLHVAA